jgi:hypothetical protein
MYSYVRIGNERWGECFEKSSMVAQFNTALGNATFGVRCCNKQQTALLTRSSESQQLFN